MIRLELNNAETKIMIVEHIKKIYPDIMARCKEPGFTDIYVGDESLDSDHVFKDTITIDLEEL